MARLKNNAYETMDINDLHQPVVVVVDMINGFVKEGALADPAIGKIIEPIADLLEKTEADNLFVCDTHESGSIEFESFPEHCLKGSAESQIVDELADFAKKKVEKNAISSFALDEVARWADSLDENTDIVVTGCCTDLCILQFVLPLKSRLNQHNKKGMRVIVPANCVETYDIPNIHDAEFWNDFALKNMEMNGIKVIRGFDSKGQK